MIKECCFDLQVVSQESTFISLVGKAMPSLTELDLQFYDADIGQSGLFAGLQPCTRLTSLELYDFSISPATVKPSAAALGRLQSLRTLTLSTSQDIDLARMLRQVTCLTSLQLGSPDNRESDRWYAAAARNTGLQVFKARACPPSADEVRHLLTACTSLTSLNFG